MLDSTESLDALRIRHSLERLDAAGNDDALILTHWGRPEALTDGRRVLGVFQRLQGQSTDWAIRHEGWEVHPEMLSATLSNAHHFEGLRVWLDARNALKAGTTPRRLDRWSLFAVRGFEALDALILTGEQPDPFAGEHIVLPALAGVTGALDYFDGAIEGARGDMSARLAYLAEYAGVAL